MSDEFDVIFNSNLIMHILFYIIGIATVEIYNYFIEIEYTISYLIMCIFISIGAIYTFISKYKKYNKGV